MQTSQFKHSLSFKYIPYNYRQIESYFVILCETHNFSFFTKDKCENKLCRKRFTDYKEAKIELDNHNKQNTLKMTICLVKKESFLERNKISDMIVRKNRTNVFILENRKGN